MVAGDAQLPERLLLAGAGGREDLRAQVPGQLDRGHPDPMRRPAWISTDSPGPQPAQLHQRVAGGRNTTGTDAACSMTSRPGPWPPAAHR